MRMLRHFLTAGLIALSVPALAQTGYESDTIAVGDDSFAVLNFGTLGHLLVLRSGADAARPFSCAEAIPVAQSFLTRQAMTDCALTGVTQVTPSFYRAHYACQSGGLLMRIEPAVAQGSDRPAPGLTEIPCAASQPDDR